MASLLSTSILLLFFFLFLTSSIPSQSEKIELSTKKKLPQELSTKKKLSSTKQIDEEQPITIKSTLSTKKKLSLSKQVDEDQPITTKSTLKNQTKLLKPKNTKSNSTTIATVKIPKSKFNKTQTLTPNPQKPTTTKIPKPEQPKPEKKTSPKPVNPDPIWLDDTSEDEDLISDFRDLPTRIHKAFLPDLKKISITSKAYIYRANRELASKVKTFVGKNFAPKIALTASCLLLILPLVLVTLLFYQLNSYLSLQRLLVFAQAYLAIYFLTLSVTAVVTGLEPLRFFYATSPASYAWTQAVQTLAYVLYLLVQLINLLVVFSAGEGGVGPKALGLAQVVVGLAVGLHYYSAVLHRAVTGDPPKANWKVHGFYAVCFLVICLFARAERRKKAYDGGEDGKVN